MANDSLKGLFASDGMDGLATIALRCPTFCFASSRRRVVTLTLLRASLRFRGLGGFSLDEVDEGPRQLLIFGVFDEAANSFFHVDVENSLSDSSSR